MPPAPVPALPLASLGEGPYLYSVVHDHVESTRQVAGGRERPVKLPLFVTLPMAPSPDSAAPPGPFPVCILLNGFQARASYYSPIARRLASWGVVVLQYNAPALTIIPDAAELPFLPVAVDWLKHAAASESAQHAALQGRVDLDRLVIAGHSRGGKLAALHYAKGSVSGLPLRTAFLIDPVDNTSFTAESPEYPSAHKALQAAGKPFALAAAGLVGSSNPEGSNWRVFQAVQPAGSWAMVLQRAGHTTFMKPPTGVETWLLDRVFGGGRMSRDLAISQTAAAMLAWFQQQLAPPSSSTSSTSSTAAVAAAASASHVPLAATGLNAAAAALTLAPAPAEAPASGSEAAAEPFGAQLLSSFRQWVTSPLVAGQVEFLVSPGAGGGAAADGGGVE